MCTAAQGAHESSPHARLPIRTWHRQQSASKGDFGSLVDLTKYTKGLGLGATNQGHQLAAGVGLAYTTLTAAQALEQPRCGVPQRPNLPCASLPAPGSHPR